MDAKFFKKWGDQVAFANVEREKSLVSLGPLSLNRIVGESVHGVKTGKIIQIVGNYSSGKSTLALDIIAQSQLKAMYVDFERTFDKDYAEAIGVDTSTLTIVRPDTAEDGYDIIREAVAHEGYKLVVIDSIAAAPPAADIDKGFTENARMAGSAGSISRFVKMITPLLDNKDALLICINQLRVNMSMGEPHQPFGGMALQFHTSVRIDLKRSKYENGIQRVDAEIRKNKAGPPRGITTLSIILGEGIDHKQDIITLAIYYDLIHQTGAWYTYKDQKYQGVQRLKEEVDIEELRTEVIRKIEDELL